jgi:hypothetical protein
MPPLEAVIGSDAAWKLTLRDQDDAAITTYTSGATLASSCWPGDDRANTFSPTAAWIDASLGTIRLSIAAAQTASLSPGIYNLQLSIAASGSTVKQNLPGLKLLPSPGSATAPKAYCSLQDLLRVFRPLSELQDLDSDQTGFAEQRGLARIWFDELLQRHFRPSSGGLTSHQRAISNWGGSWRSGQRSIYLSGLLDADKLLLANASGQPNSIPHCVAHHAVGLILQDQLGSVGETSYQKVARRMFAEADRLAGLIVAEVDSNNDGLPDIHIDLGITDVLYG